MIQTLLAILSFGVQNLCCKEYGRRFPSTLYAESVMIVVITAIVTGIMAALGGVKPLTAQGFVIALAFGIFFVMTLATMTLAMNYGHMGITLLIQNSSLMVPTVYGVLFWGEKLTVLKVIGIVLILALLALSSVADTAPADAATRKNWNRKKWLILTGMAFLGDCVLGILQGMMSRACADTDSVTFTFWTSLISLAAALLLVLWCVVRGQNKRLLTDADSKKWFAITCAGIGVGTAGGNCFSIAALTVIPGVVMFPVRQGSLVLVMWFVGVLLYGEKITRRGLLMLLLGLAGIVLLNL